MVIVVFTLISLRNRLLLPVGWADGTPVKSFPEGTRIEVVVLAPEFLTVRGRRSAGNLPLVPC